MDPEDALRDFKIAYSAMCGVLEPNRKRHAPSAFTRRKDVRYGLRPEADLWLDAAEFKQLIRQGDQLFEADREKAIALYQQALALYGGDYLQAYPYYDWATTEQEYTLTLYLGASERVARYFISQEAFAEAIQLCLEILARDNCWEAAYRLLMLAYNGQGKRIQALQTFERCQTALQEKWGVEPMPETVEIYRVIRQPAS
jgi:two-component SAPR family response regulator